MSIEESRRELKRRRQVRDREPSDESETEILVCPVEGCSRTVVDDRAGLIHHVRESRDDGHRFKRLTEDLELVTDRERYHAMWGPRLRENEGRDGNWSIYRDGDPWVPGVPKTTV